MKEFRVRINKESFIKANDEEDAERIFWDEITMGYGELENNAISDAFNIFDYLDKKSLVMDLGLDEDSDWKLNKVDDRGTFRIVEE